MNRLTQLLLRLTGQLTAELLIVGVAFVLAFLAFLLITHAVFGGHPEHFDQAAFDLADRLRAAAPGLTPWVERITFFGSLPWFVGVVLLVPAVLWRLQHRREAIEIGVAAVGSAALNELLKHLFGRVRPLSALIPQPGLSFPSGHAMIGLALYAMLALQLWRYGHHPVWAALLFGWALLIGATRVYLHVHYATDVLAGFSAAVVWVIVAHVAIKRRLGPAPRP